MDNQQERMRGSIERRKGTKERRRGVILTPKALEKLQEAKLETEIRENNGISYTLEALSDRTGLDSHTLIKVFAGETGVDRRTLSRCFQAFNLSLEPNDYYQPALRVEKFEEEKTALAQNDKESNQNRQDWDRATDVSIFFGRAAELATLKHCIQSERCRLVMLWGIGGIGKPWLATKLAKLIKLIKDEFEIWAEIEGSCDEVQPVYEEDLLPAIAQAEDVVISVPQKLEKGGILKLYINNDGNKYPDPILYTPDKILKPEGLSLIGNDRKEVFQEVSGYFLVPEPGNYNFTLDFPSSWNIRESRNLRAKIDGVLLSTTRGGRVSLEKGWHKINLFLYAYNIDGNLLRVSWGLQGEESKPLKVWREVKDKAVRPTPTNNNQPEIFNTAQPGDPTVNGQKTTLHV